MNTTTGRVIRIADNDQQRFHGHIVDTSGKLTLKQAASKTDFSEWAIRAWTQANPPKIQSWKLPTVPGSQMKCIWVDEQEVIAYAATRKPRTASTTITNPLYWTNDDRERVAEEFALLRLTEPLAVVSELLRRAQESGLPPEKRKRNLMLANDPTLRKLILVKWEQATDSNYAMPVVIREPKVEPILDIARSLEEAPLDELCGVAMKRYIKSVTEKQFSFNLPIHTAAVPPASLPTNEAPTSTILPTHVIEKVTAKSPKYRIAILGFFKQQFEELAKKVQYEDLELIHVAMDQDKRPGSVPPSVDYALCSKFIGHSGWEKAQADMGFDRVRMVMGGLSKMREKIVEVRSQLIQRNGK